MAEKKDDPRRVFPRTFGLLEPALRSELAGLLPAGRSDALPEHLQARGEALGLAAYLADLARIELQVARSRDLARVLPAEAPALSVNPTLGLVAVGWKELPAFFDDSRKKPVTPVAGPDLVLVWVTPEKGELRVRSAAPDELLALKIVLEELDRQEVARQQGVTPLVLDRTVRRAVARGLLLAPPSRLERHETVFAAHSLLPEKYRAARVFTLQWHLTQACDLHCRHCYDRSARQAVSLPDALDALDQLRAFCEARQVAGQVSFTGGNPLLHPQFFEIYQAAADRGLMTAILGNPTDRHTLGRITAIQQPEFFQVSLEGLEEHNDFIRGAGHFERVLDFLVELKQAGIYSMVMLTLTRDNMNQVLPLGELLRGRTDLFTFNRLSMVGEGASLVTPDRAEYEVFLEKYLAARPGNPVLALKDNLINCLLYKKNEPLFGGCAGFGCGAAFNFAALLPDGELHACRKFPSPIGSLAEKSLAALYDSQTAENYRLGPTACRGCPIRPVCGGCLAVVSSQGLDCLVERDPCCLLAEG